MKASEQIQHDRNTREKTTFSMRELCAIFNTDKGGVRRILRNASVGSGLQGKGGKDVWEYPAVLHAAQQWEAQQ